MDLEGIVEICNQLKLSYSHVRDNNERVGPQISISCFPKGTPVMTSKGLVPIDKIKIGDYVLTHESGYQKVKATHVKSFTGNLITTSFKGLNYSITSTDNHRVYNYKNNDIIKLRKDIKISNSGKESVKINDVPPKIHATEELSEIKTLKIKDRLVLPFIPNKDILVPLIDPLLFNTRTSTGKLRKHRKSCPEVYLSKELAHLLGLWSAKGCSTGDIGSGYSYTGFTFRNGEPSVKKCTKLIKNIFNETPTIRTDAEHNTQRVYIYNSFIARWLPYILGHKAPNKIIPEFIMTSSIEIKKAFLEGLRAGDGCRYAGSKSTKAGKWESISTTSITMSFQLPILLGSLGIACRRTSRAERIDKNGVHHRESYEVCWADTQDQCVGQKILNKMTYPIKEIVTKEVKDILVYNMTVENDESYIVGSVVVKNCPLAPLRHKDPYDHNMGCSVKIDPDGPSVVRCFSGSCGFKGSWAKMLELALDGTEHKELLESVQKTEAVTLESLLDKSKKKSLKKKIIKSKDIIPESRWDDFKHPLPSYASERGIKPETAERWSLGHDVKLKRLVFPIRDKDKNLVGMQGRDITNQAERRHHNYDNFNRQLYLLGEHLLEPNKPIVIVEGATGVVKTDQALYPMACSVAVLGEGFSKEHADTICSFNPPYVYIFMDGDGPGRTMTKKIHRMLQGRVSIKLIECPIDLLEDGSKKDPGNLPAEDIVRLFNSAKYVLGKKVEFSHDLSQ